MKKLSLILLLTMSCASVSKADWYEVAPALEKQSWRLCTKERDGDKKHLKGLCYISKECRNRFLRSRICRPKPLYCSFSEVDCIAKHAYSNKVFKIR